MATMVRLVSIVRARKRLAIFIGFLLLLGWAQEDGFLSTTHYMCVRCRRVQHVTTCFGIESVRVEENAYSRWYEQWEPQHTHQWGWCGTVITHYPIGMARGCGVQSGVWMIAPDRQAKFVKNASKAELGQFYLDLLSHDRKIRERVIALVYEWLPEDNR